MGAVWLSAAVDADVAIVGAGPAGASAAVHLARRGLKVLLLEQHRFPRDKVCGDFVGPVAVGELEDLGVAQRKEFVQSNRITRSALHLDGEPLIEQALPTVGRFPGIGRVIPRVELDHWIVEAAVKAGVELLEDHRLRSFRADTRGVTLDVEVPTGSRSFRVRAIVGADGSTSTVARAVRGAAALRVDRIVALRAYFEGVRGPVDRADLYFSADSFPGYCWVFPSAHDSANVGIGVVLDTLPPMPEHLRELLQSHLDHDAAIGRRLKGARLVGRVVGWPLATFNPNLPVAADRALLIGDAAGLINPLNGEGIQYALLSARWAAEALADASSQDFSQGALSSYRRRIMLEIGYDMHFSRTIVQAIRNRALTPVFIQALRIIVERASQDRSYATLAGGLLAGVVPAQDVMSARLVWGTAAQTAAWMADAAARQLASGPVTLGGSAVEAARVGFGLLHDGIRQPAEVIGWSARLARETVSLAVATPLRHRARPYK
jgi:geranylgeranyl reductase family protein